MANILFLDPPAGEYAKKCLYCKTCMNLQHERHVRIDPEKLRQNVDKIRQLTQRPVIAVVKADAYGCGAREVVDAIAEKIDAFYTFSASESVSYGLFQRTGKSTIALHGDADVETMWVNKIRPCVWTVEQARKFSGLNSVLMVDTGQQRFACDPSAVRQLLKLSGATEAMTHASRLEQVQLFRDATDGLNLTRHAAGSALLNEPAAHLDAVRPGMAIYDGAVRVSSRLIECKPSGKPAGYSGFVATHIGVIPVGYSNGLRPGPCKLNGRTTRILECGMQSSFIEAAPTDEIGDEVILLGDDLSCKTISQSWKCSPQEVLLNLTRVGQNISM